MVDSKSVDALFARGLEQALRISEDETEELKRSSVGPFTSGMRVKCPLRGFASRRTRHCIPCSFCEGVAKRVVIGELGPAPQAIAAAYTIICGFPTCRSIEFAPED